MGPTGPQNAPVGDGDEPMKMPETKVDEQQLIEEKKLAKYSQTAEFKRLKEYLEARVKFYQNYLPDGRKVDEASVNKTTGEMWVVANAIIGEINNILSEYERAKEVVDERSKG